MATVTHVAPVASELYPLNAPGMPLPGNDLLKLAEALGDNTELVRERGVYRLVQPGETLTMLFRRVLYSDGQFTIPVTVNAQTRRQVPVLAGHVWGSRQVRHGPVPSDVMVIGKMLGEDEVAMRRQFVGPSGQLLLDTCRKFEIRCRDWYMTNLMKTEHPTGAGSGTLKSGWVAEWLPFLHQELRIVRPKYILCLGSDAAKALLGRQARRKGGLQVKNLEATMEPSVSNMEGRVVEVRIPLARTADEEPTYQDALLMVIPHPAAILRTPEQLSKFEDAVCRFGQLIRGNRFDLEEQGVDHRVIDNLQDLENLCYEIQADCEDNLLAIDCEWHGQHPQNDGSYLRTIQLSWKPKTAACISLRHPGGAERFEGGIEAALALVTKICRGRRIAGHFLNADMEWLVYNGVDLRPEFSVAETWEQCMEDALVHHKGGFDTAYAAHALDETGDFALTPLALKLTSAPRYDVPLLEWKKRYCSENGLKDRELDGFGMCPDEVLEPYALYDADVTRRIAVILQQQLSCDRFGNCCWEPFWITMRACPAVFEINTSGILVDRERMDQLTDTYMAAATSIEADIREQAKWPDLKLTSPFHIRELLFGEKLNGKQTEDGKPVRLRPEGAQSLYLMPVTTTDKRPMRWTEVIERRLEKEKTPSTNRTALSILAQEATNVRRKTTDGKTVTLDLSGLVNRLRDHRFIAQTLRLSLRPPVMQGEEYELDSYGNRVYPGGLPAAICHDGRVRTTIYPVKETGRWSSARPNLHNFSKRRESDYKRILGEGYRMPIRTILRAPKGRLLVEADYIGAELFVMAVMSGDKAMIEHSRRNQLREDHPNFYDIHSSIACLAFGYDCPPTKAGLASIGKKDMRIVAKCVTAGSRLHTDQGLLPVESLVDPAIPSDSGQIYSGQLQVANHLTTTPIVGVYNGGLKSCMAVETEYGYRLEGTRVHRYWVMGEDGRMCFRQARHLRLGDWVAVRAGFGPFGTDTTLPQVPVEARTSFRPIAFPEQFNEDWAAFLGFYVAEGCADPESGLVQLVLAHETDPEFADQAEALLRRLFGDRLQVSEIKHEQYQNQRRFCVSAVALARWLAAVCPGDSHMRRVPEVVFRWPEPLVRTFLRWVFEGDGCAKVNGRGFDVEYSTASQQLGKDIQLLLSLFGIVSARRTESREGHDGVYTAVRLVTNASRDRFVARVGFVTAAKTARCRQTSQFCCDRRVIPGQVARLRQLLPHLSGIAREKCRECVRDRARVSLSPSRLQMILGAVSPDLLPAAVLSVYQELQELLLWDVSFQRITKLEGLGRRQVYDVQTTADFGHLVSYNGLLTHQTVAFGVAYGRGAKAIALAAKEEGVEVSVEEAQRVIDAIFQRYPRLRPFFEACKARARKERWMCNCFGRFRRFPRATDAQVLGDFERQAMNFPIQSAIADAVSRAVDHLMVYRREHPEVDFNIALQIHDALLLEVPAEHVAQVVDDVLPTCMCKQVPIYPTDMNGVPSGDGPYHLGVDTNIYQFWGEDMTPEQCQALGIHPRYARWNEHPRGWTHPEKSGKVWTEGRFVQAP